MNVSAYADFIQRLKGLFGRKKPETYHIETLPIIEEVLHEEPKEDVLIITPEEESLPPPPAADVLTLGGGSLASLQEGLILFTFGAPCMNHEMHEEEEVDNIVGTVEEQPSSILVVGEHIALVVGTLVDVQDVLEI